MARQLFTAVTLFAKVFSSVKVSECTAVYFSRGAFLLTDSNRCTFLMFQKVYSDVPVSQMRYLHVQCTHTVLCVQFLATKRPAFTARNFLIEISWPTVNYSKYCCGSTYQPEFTKDQFVIISVDCEQSLFSSKQMVEEATIENCAMSEPQRKSSFHTRWRHTDSVPLAPFIVRHDYL